MWRKNGRREGVKICTASSAHTSRGAAHQDRPGKRVVDVFATPTGCFGDSALAGFALAERLVCFFGFVIVL
jgi:hypothetical protein